MMMRRRQEPSRHVEVVEGRLKVIIDEEFPFTRDGVVSILKKVASGKSLGKNILRII